MSNRDKLQAVFNEANEKLKDRNMVEFLAFCFGVFKIDADDREVKIIEEELPRFLEE